MYTPPAIKTANNFFFNSDDSLYKAELRKLTIPRIEIQPIEPEFKFQITDFSEPDPKDVTFEYEKDNALKFGIAVEDKKPKNKPSSPMQKSFSLDVNEIPFIDIEHVQDEDQYLNINGKKLRHQKFSSSLQDISSSTSSITSVIHESNLDLSQLDMPVRQKNWKSPDEIRQGHVKALTKHFEGIFVKKRNVSFTQSVPNLTECEEVNEKMKSYSEENLDGKLSEYERLELKKLLHDWSTLGSNAGDNLDLKNFFQKDKSFAELNLKSSKSKSYSKYYKTNLEYSNFKAYFNIEDDSGLSSKLNFESSKLNSSDSKINFENSKLNFEDYKLNFEDTKLNFEDSKLIYDNSKSPKFSNSTFEQSGMNFDSFERKDSLDCESSFNSKVLKNNNLEKNSIGMKLDEILELKKELRSLSAKFQLERFKSNLKSSNFRFNSEPDLSPKTRSKLEKEGLIFIGKYKSESNVSKPKVSEVDFSHKCQFRNCIFNIDFVPLEVNKKNKENVSINNLVDESKENKNKGRLKNNSKYNDFEKNHKKRTMEKLNKDDVDGSNNKENIIEKINEDNLNGKSKREIKSILKNSNEYLNIEQRKSYPYFLDKKNRRHSEILISKPFNTQLVRCGSLERLTNAQNKRSKSCNVEHKKFPESYIVRRSSKNSLRLNRLNNNESYKEQNIKFEVQNGKISTQNTKSTSHDFKHASQDIKVAPQNAKFSSTVHNAKVIVFHKLIPKTWKSCSDIKYKQKTVRKCCRLAKKSCPISKINLETQRKTRSCLNFDEESFDAVFKLPAFRPEFERPVFHHYQFGCYVDRKLYGGCIEKKCTYVLHWLNYIL